MSNIFDKINGVTKNKALCIVVDSSGSTPRKIGAKMLVTNDSEISGTIGGGALEFQVIKDAVEVIKTRIPKIYKYNLLKDFNMGCGGTVDIYIEPILNKKKLYIFGAGHIGKILAQFASQLDFDVHVIDHRQDIFNNWNIENSKITNTEHDNFFKETVFDSDSFICIMTHAHIHDKAVLEYCIKQEFAYLGVIASKRKVKELTDYLITNNIAEMPQIQKVDMPMGIPITCETPHEIAISVLAKLIDVRAKNI